VMEILLTNKVVTNTIIATSIGFCSLVIQPMGDLRADLMHELYLKLPFS